LEDDVGFIVKSIMNCGSLVYDAVCSCRWFPAFAVVWLFHHLVGYVNLFPILYSDFSVWKLKMKVACSSEM